MPNTSSSVATVFFDQTGQVYPCRCGVTHVGDYAPEDFNHHNCLHPGPLIMFADLSDIIMCDECGEIWNIKMLNIQNR